MAAVNVRDGVEQVGNHARRVAVRVPGVVVALAKPVHLLLRQDHTSPRAFLSAKRILSTIPSGTKYSDQYSTDSSNSATTA